VCLCYRCCFSTAPWCYSGEREYEASVLASVTEESQLLCTMSVQRLHDTTGQLHRHVYDLLSLSVLTAIFPGEPELPSFNEAKDDGNGGNNWSCKTCKAPVKLSPPTNQHPTFYWADALPVTQPTVSKHWRDNFYDLLYYINCNSTLQQYFLH